MKITKIRRAVEKCPTYDVTTRSGAYALKNGCVSHNSSVVLNSTNGVNLVKELIVTKRSKAGDFVQVVPEYRKLKKHYQLLWQQTDCVEYLKTVAVLQAYVDQGISTDEWYSPRHFPNGKIDVNVVARNHMLAHKWGIKSFYYYLVEKQAAMEAVTKSEKSIDEVNALLAEISEQQMQSEFKEKLMADLDAYQGEVKQQGHDVPIVKTRVVLDDAFDDDDCEACKL